MNVIDLHSHLLPGLDDGPAAVGESLEMARAAAADGITCAVATPHVDHGYGIAPAAILAAAIALRTALREADVDLEVLTGGEVTVTRLPELSDPELSAVALGRSSWVLLECPLRPAREALDRGVFELSLRGYRPLLAHPERSPDLQRDPDRVAKLVDRGALCSVSAGALVGSFGSTVRKFAFRLLAEGLVHNIASDAHDPHRRPLVLGAARDVAAEREGPEVARWLVEDVPNALLEGAEPPAPPAGRRAGRSRWSRFRPMTRS